MLGVLTNTLFANLRSVGSPPADGKPPFPVDVKVIDLLKERTTVLRDNLAEGVSSATFDSKCQIVGELMTLGLAEKTMESLDEGHQILMAVIRNGGVVVDRELRHLLEGVNLRQFFDMSPHLKTVELLQGVKKQVAIVVRAVGEISRQCLCNVVLPPCPPCDDLRVLLARITVINCQAVDICNVKRKFVITGPSLRYWFSDFGIINRILSSCCPTSEDIDRAKLVEDNRQKDQRDQWRIEISSPAFAFDLQQRTDNPTLWEKISGQDIDRLGRSAIEPSGKGLLEALDEGEDPTPQMINDALSKLASRPAADIRSILDRTASGKTTADLERELRDEIDDLEEITTGFEDDIELARQQASNASVTATNAETVAGNARTTADHCAEDGGQRSSRSEQRAVRRRRRADRRQRCADGRRQRAGGGRQR